MSDQVQRSAELRWVCVRDMRVSAVAQRALDPAQVNKIVANFDPDKFGVPEVSFRDGHYYVMDGQHRIQALRQLGWEDQKVQCWVTSGLHEEHEAERFLGLNDNRAVSAYAKFTVAVTARRQEQVDIDDIVRSVGLRISQEKKDGAVSAVGSLERVYRLGGPACLTRTLIIIRDAYGDPGLQAAVIRGIGLVCARYDNLLDDERTTAMLSRASGGVGGLMRKAEVIRRAVGGGKYHAVGAAVVEILNSGRGGKKLPPWFRGDSGKFTVIA